MALITALAVLEVTRIWHLAVISLVTGVALSLHYPAYSAWLPALVPEGVRYMVRPPRCWRL